MNQFQQILTPQNTSYKRNLKNLEQFEQQNNLNGFVTTNNFYKNKNFKKNMNTDKKVNPNSTNKVPTQTMINQLLSKNKNKSKYDFQKAINEYKDKYFNQIANNTGEKEGKNGMGQNLMNNQQNLMNNQQNVMNNQQNVMNNQQNIQHNIQQLQQFQQMQKKNSYNQKIQNKQGNQKLVQSQ